MTRLLAVGDPLYDQHAPLASAARPGEGVLITQVEFPKGVKGPIVPNDVLLTYDGQEILDVKQFKKVLGEIEAKRKALPTGQSFKPSVTVLRGEDPFVRAGPPLQQDHVQDMAGGRCAFGQGVDAVDIAAARHAP